MHQSSLRDATFESANRLMTYLRASSFAFARYHCIAKYPPRAMSPLPISKSRRLPACRLSIIASNPAKAHIVIVPQVAYCNRSPGSKLISREIGLWMCRIEGGIKCCELIANNHELLPSPGPAGKTAAARPSAPGSRQNTDTASGHPAC